MMSEQPGGHGRPPRDPGLQPERTALAWQRTALSMGAAVLVVVRLTVGSLGAIALAVLVFCVAHAAVVFGHAQRRYGARTGSSTRQTLAVGLHGALLALQVILLAALEVAALVGAPPS